jgi:hypothetical protein
VSCIFNLEIEHLGEQISSSAFFRLQRFPIPGCQRSFYFYEIDFTLSLFNPMLSPLVFSTPGSHLADASDQRSRPFGVTNKIKFSPEEERRLLELVHEQGTNEWKRIAGCMETRNAR